MSVFGKMLQRLTSWRHEAPTGTDPNPDAVCAGCKKSAKDSDNAPDNHLVECATCVRSYCPHVCFTNHHNSIGK